MSEQCLYQWALWLETIGFFISAVLILFVKWQALKCIFDGLKSFIVRLPSRLFKFFEPIAWLLSHMATEGGKIPKGIEPERLPKYQLKQIIWVAFITPVLLILLTALVILIYLPALIAKLFSGHNVITNTLIVVGTAMILAGLIIELVTSY
jgi:hypothetical protein